MLGSDTLGGEVGEASIAHPSGEVAPLERTVLHPENSAAWDVLGSVSPTKKYTNCGPTLRWSTPCTLAMDMDAPIDPSSSILDACTDGKATESYIAVGTSAYSVRK